MLDHELKNRTKKATRLALQARIADATSASLDDPEVRQRLVAVTPSRGPLLRRKWKGVWPIYSSVSEETWEMAGIILDEMNGVRQ